MKLQGLTTEELLLKEKEICAAPENKAPTGSFFLYTKTASKKLEKIREQITHNIAMKRAAAGNPVRCDGYSGRKQNRR